MRIDTSRDLCSGPKEKREELEVAIFDDRGTWPIGENVTLIESQNGEKGITFNQDRGATMREDKPDTEKSCRSFTKGGGSE
jgi:hypothetical protein